MNTIKYQLIVSGNIPLFVSFVQFVAQKNSLKSLRLLILLESNVSANRRRLED